MTSLFIFLELMIEVGDFRGMKHGLQKEIHDHSFMLQTKMHKYDAKIILIIFKFM